MAARFADHPEAVAEAGRLAAELHLIDTLSGPVEHPGRALSERQDGRLRSRWR